VAEPSGLIRPGARLPDASVVVVGASADELWPTLETMRATATAAELIVVAPDVLDAVGATAVCSSEGSGSLLGANQGADMADGQVIVIVSAGVRVRPGWITGLLAAFADPTVGVVGPKLLGPDGRVVAAGLVVRGDGAVEPFGVGLDADERAVDTPHPVDAVSGVCVAVRGVLWQDLGGFDARFAPAGGEDLDLCFAARAAGWQVRYEPTAAVEVDGTGLSWDAGRERFASKWRAALADQEPPGWPMPVSADRSRRAVELRRPRHRRTPPAGRPIAVVGPTRDGGRLADRARSLAAVLRAAGRTVDIVDLSRSPALPADADVWAVGCEAIERIAVAVRPARPDVVIVADMPSVRSAVLRQRAGSPHGPQAAEIEAAEDTERWALGLADLVTTTSTPAATRLQAVVPGAAVHVIPLASSVGPPCPLPGRGQPTLVVRVDAADDNDVAGARWLLREVVARVQLTFTELTTAIVGDATRPEVRHLAGPGVRFVTGARFDPTTVPVTVAVGPWRWASGMHPWTVEALARGIPLVTTRAGAEGVPLVSGRDAVLIDDADGMARAVVGLITDHARWASLSAAGQAVVGAHLDPAVIASADEKWLGTPLTPAR
jgi:hypothetical protein